MTVKGNILIIVDEVEIRRLLKITLTANGYKIFEASTGQEGIALASSVQPVLLVLDLRLPDANGFDILKKLRECYQKPIIVLSFQNFEDDVIKALDYGANDYITKPFRKGEFLARIRVAVRQNHHIASNQILKFGPISIDVDNYIARKNNKIIKLTLTEFKLLALLAKNGGRVLTHQFILEEVWGMDYKEQTQSLRVFIAQLRKKVEDNPAEPKLLYTESGIGYRFGS